MTSYFGVPLLRRTANTLAWLFASEAELGELAPEARIELTATAVQGACLDGIPLPATQAGILASAARGLVEEGYPASDPAWTGLTAGIEELEPRDERPPEESDYQRILDREPANAGPLELPVETLPMATAYACFHTPSATLRLSPLQLMGYLASYQPREEELRGWMATQNILAADTRQAIQAVLDNPHQVRASFLDASVSSPHGDLNEALSRDPHVGAEARGASAALSLEKVYELILATHVPLEPWAWDRDLVLRQLLDAHPRLDAREAEAMAMRLLPTFSRWMSHDTLEFDYTDESGGQRHWYVSNARLTKDGYVYGFCHLRDEFLAFSPPRMAGVEWTIPDFQLHATMKSPGSGPGAA
ncbi:hypothetical protein CATYP_09380 [Corynebacterium atypicum]|uniref:Uncharacterized protein n=1 Tax=Corynebacterium atypicum TaxID=191610 RepID=A0ABM5QPL3_9CORY|nr:hypothetical protein [Corynebacterium atypicum]AIG64731.1 hypothetical protein CATYP_09380 [Corynebacterium atypicum]